MAGSTGQAATQQHQLRREHVHQRSNATAQALAVTAPNLQGLRITGIGLCTELAGIAITQAPQAGDAGELLQGATVAAVAGRTIGLNPDQTGFRCSAVVAREQLTP